MVEIDNSFRSEGVPMRRFFMERMKDQTGVSRTGRVLEGVIAQDGQVVIQWRPPHTSIAIYKNFETFRIIHVDCHPSCNRVVFLDPPQEKCRLCDGTGELEFKTCSNCKGSGEFRP